MDEVKLPSLLVYIPTYNRGASVLKQLDCFEAFQKLGTRHRLQVVIQDNASPPCAEYSEAARRCAALGFRYVRNPVNLGGNPNILKGFDYLSDADYLWICSDDELLRPNALSDVFAHLQAQPGIDVLSLSQVARTQDSVETVDPTQALDQLNIAGFGLISLVIYRSAWVQPHVRAGHDKLLSCFPHLAVFFEAVRKTGQSRFLFVSVDSLFFPGGRKNAPADSDAYLLAHYGFVMLAECFDGELRKTFCSRWWKVHSVHSVAKARLAPAHSGACFGILRRHLPFFRTRYALARVRVPIWLLRQSFERRLVALYRSPRAKHPALKIPLEKLKNWYRKVLGQV